MTVTSTIVGADVTTTATTATHAVGTKLNGTLGAEYVYVKAGSAIAINDVVAVDSTYAAAVPLTKALADTGVLVAVAPVAIASGSYGWVQTKGVVSVNLLTLCLPSVPLYTSATAGKLDDTTTSQTQISGIVALATNGSATAVAISCVLTYPKSATF